MSVSPGAQAGHSSPLGVELLQSHSCSESASGVTRFLVLTRGGAAEEVFWSCEAHLSATSFPVCPPHSADPLLAGRGDLQHLPDAKCLGVDPVV